MLTLNGGLFDYHYPIQGQIDDAITIHKGQTATIDLLENDGPTLGKPTHFENRDCVFLSYHLPVPQLDPLITPLSEHMARWLQVIGCCATRTTTRYHLR